MRKDPENLPTSHQPALIRFLDETEMFVAHQTTQESGWLWVVGWSGSRRKIPPHRIAYVESIDVETRHDGYGPDETSYRVVKDDELRAKARKAAGLTDDEESDDRREVVA